MVIKVMKMGGKPELVNVGEICYKKENGKYSIVNPDGSQCYAVINTINFWDCPKFDTEEEAREFLNTHFVL